MSRDQAYALFDTQVIARETLTPWLMRFTFGGEGVRGMRTLAPDQRIKLVFPEGGQVSRLKTGTGWYGRYKSLADEVRPVLRTYTIRALDAEAGRLDIDFVLHGDTGPATRWAQTAQPGAALQIGAPRSGYDGNPGGYEWRPPEKVQRLLLLADETAFPAVAGILEQVAAWPDPPDTEVFIEVPAPGARIALPQWPGLQVRWAVRPAHAPSRLPAAVRQAWTPAPALTAMATVDQSAVDIDTGTLWETASPADPGFYVWAAGEAAAMLSIRRYLTAERGVPADCLNVMGYWRMGRVLD